MSRHDHISKIYGLLTLLSILARSHTNNLLEAMRQVALTTKPHLTSHLCQRFAGLNQPLRLTNADTFQVRIGRHTRMGAKCPQQIIRAERNVLRDLAQADPMHKSLVNVATGTSYSVRLSTEPLLGNVDVRVALDEL